LYHSNSGIVYNWGWGGGFRLGHGDENQRLKPSRLQFFQKLRVLDIACGWRHVLAICDDGHVYSWGSNSQGQLGHGDFISRMLPTKIEKFCESVVQIRCGDYFSMALSSSGTVYCWGSGEYGQSGEAEATWTVPTVMETLMLQAKSISSISAGANHAIALSYSGDAYSWGCGTNGQLGHNIGSGEEISNLPSRVEVDFKVCEIFCGRENSFFIAEHAPYVDVMDSVMKQDMTNLLKVCRTRYVGVYE
jgi:alpha-tubulin suppressor-like RCC1 family protein